MLILKRDELVDTKDGGYCLPSRYIDLGKDWLTRQVLEIIDDYANKRSQQGQVQ